MFDWVLNTHTSEVDNKDTRRTTFMFFLCFFCWLWTNFVHWFSCIFDTFHKLMFPLFWTSKHHLGKVLKIEKKRWRNTIVNCFNWKNFGIKNVLLITKKNIIHCKTVQRKTRSVRLIKAWVRNVLFWLFGTKYFEKKFNLELFYLTIVSRTFILMSYYALPTFLKLLVLKK